MQLPKSRLYNYEYLYPQTGFEMRIHVQNNLALM